MSSIDQAFVKAYARRQLSSHRTTSDSTSHALNDDGLVVDRSVADSASVWIDQGNDVLSRVDPAHTPNRQPATSNVVAPSSSIVAKKQSASPDAKSIPDAKSASVDKSPKPTDHSPIATIHHVHTAYAIAEGDSSWIDAITSKNIATPIATTLEVVSKVTSDESTNSIASAPSAPNNRVNAGSARETHTLDHPSIDIRIEAPGRIDPVAHSIDAPHARLLPLDQDRTESRLDSLASTSVKTTSQRQPSVETPAPQVTHEFHAKWEIDALDVPSVVADLFFDGELFQQVAQQLAEAADTGLRRVLVTSVHDGEGRSTVAIGLAIAAAASGKRVALIDADTTSPTLVDDLRLDLEFGWIEAIRGRLPLEEICVHATQDGVTLVPLLAPHGATAATARETRELIEKLDQCFDLLIVDGGSSQCPATAGTLSQYDSAMIVFNKTRTATADINEYSYQLRSSGVSGVGVVENFVS